MSKKLKAVCPECDGTFSVNASGEIHGHKCTVILDKTDWKKKYMETKKNFDFAMEEVASLKEKLHKVEKSLLNQQIDMLKKLNPQTPQKP